MFNSTPRSRNQSDQSLPIYSLSPIPFSQLSVFLSEPSFVFADVISEGSNRVDGEDDKIYYFFTEVSVEYEFFGKLLIPRVARVCKVSARHHVPSAHTSYPSPPAGFVYIPLSHSPELISWCKSSTVSKSYSSSHAHTSAQPTGSKRP